MTVAIITAIYDDYDTLKSVCKQSIDVEWICVTDSSEFKLPEAMGWEFYYEPRPHIHPNRAAKLPKCLPWLYTGAEASIWIDASYQVVSPTFAEDVLRYAAPMAQFKHPWRDCAYDEAQESLLLNKYQDNFQIISNQMQRLKYNNHPRHWGLWATGVIARYHTQDVVDAGHDWLAQIYNYSFQDQISHPDCMRRYGIDVINLPGTHFSNEWLEYHGSGRH